MELKVRAKKLLVNNTTDTTDATDGQN